jgi:hypothetical protein
MKFVRPPFVVEDIEIRQLHNTEITEALRFLHAVYINENEWRFPTSNGSGLQIRHDKHGEYLYDLFVEKAAWFGAVHENRVIGCLRVLVDPVSELRYYIDLPDVLSCAPASELNRFAFTKEWRGKQTIMLSLLRAALDYASIRSEIVYAAVQTGKFSKIYRRFGFRSTGHPPFKYDPSDPMPVEILYYDTRVACRHSTLLYRLTDHLAVDSGEVSVGHIQRSHGIGPWRRQITCTAGTVCNIREFCLQQEMSL